MKKTKNKYDTVRTIPKIELSNFINSRKQNHDTLKKYTLLLTGMIVTGT